MELVNLDDLTYEAEWQWRRRINTPRQWAIVTIDGDDFLVDDTFEYATPANGRPAGRYAIVRGTAKDPEAIEWAQLIKAILADWQRAA